MTKFELKGLACRVHTQREADAILSLLEQKGEKVASHIVDRLVGSRDNNLIILSKKQYWYVSYFAQRSPETVLSFGVFKKLLEDYKP